MSQSPLQIMDDLLAPIITSANRVRQVRDSLPEAAWMIVPLPIRAPLDALFAAVEEYDRALGRMKAAGLVSGVGTRPAA